MNHASLFTSLRDAIKHAFNADAAHLVQHAIDAEKRRALLGLPDSRPAAAFLDKYVELYSEIPRHWISSLSHAMTDLVSAMAIQRALGDGLALPSSGGMPEPLLKITSSFVKIHSDTAAHIMIDICTDTGAAPEYVLGMATNMALEYSRWLENDLTETSRAA